MATTIAVASLLSTLEARADDASSGEPRHTLKWDERWPRPGLAEYALTVTLAAANVAVLALPIKDRGWSGNGLDDAFRTTLRLHDPSARQTARTVGDSLYYGLIAYPVLIDAFLVAGPRSSDVAWQMFVMDAESMAISGIISQTAERAGGRARPFVRDCSGSSRDPSCGGEDNFMSFVSGHTAIAFTGAGLTCAHHTHLPLYGGGAPDVLACVAAGALATGEGVLRIAADRHYATDVTIGAVVGFASGYGLPMWLHYTGQSASSTAKIVVPYATGSQAGIVAVGRF